ncbi:MAG: DUF1059 domain-containing protein [Nitrospira sp.]|nr:DUF1059 domain-containing protein [Nitrospira sp.]
MGKMVECATVDPSSGCKHVVGGNTEEEVLKNATEHVKQDGTREVLRITRPSKASNQR